MCALLTIAGTGVGPMYPVTTVVIQNVVAPHHTGTATGTLNFFRQLGGAFIVAVFGAIVLGALGNAGDAAALDTLAGAQPRRRRLRRHLPLGVRRRGGLPRRRLPCHDGGRGTAAARPRPSQS